MDRLKLYRVVMYASVGPIIPVREFMVLGYDGDTACDLALKRLGHPRNRKNRKLTKIEEVEGPYEEGRILYYRSYNGDDGETRIQKP